MRDRDPSRPRPKKKRSRSSRDENGVPMWAKIGAGVIAVLGLIGTIIKFAERRNKPDPVQNAAVAPAQPALGAADPKTQPPVPAPKRRPVSSEPPAARELVATVVSVREVASEIPGKPFDLVVEYEYSGSAPASGLDVVEFVSPVSDGGVIINDTALKGSVRFTPASNGQLDGELRFWIDRREGDQPRLRISNIYTHRR